jgi:hypothetical protein
MVYTDFKKTQASATPPGQFEMILHKNVYKVMRASHGDTMHLHCFVEDWLQDSSSSRLSKECRVLMLSGV